MIHRIRGTDATRQERSDARGEWIAYWGVTCAVAAAVAAIVSQLLDFGVYGLRIRMFDMNTHASIFGVASLLALLASVIVAVLLAAATMRNRAAVSLPMLLTVLLVLRVIHPAHVILIAFPVVVLTFVILWWRAGGSQPPAPRLIHTGCAALVCSYLVHGFGAGVSSRLAYGGDRWPHQITLALMHSGELAGWAIVATGLIVAYLGGREREAPNPSGDRAEVAPYGGPPASSWSRNLVNHRTGE